MTEIKIEHTDDSMSITVCKVSNHWKAPWEFSNVNEGIEPPLQATFERRRRRATREAGQ